MDVFVGDRVQIVDGGIDVTNGNRAKSGRYYGEGGPLWANVESITNDWKTGSRYGLPSSVVKVRCSAGGVVVWQVQPEHIAKDVIQASKPEIVETKVPTVKSPTIPPTTAGLEDLKGKVYQGSNKQYISNAYYAPKRGSEVWTEKGGLATSGNTTDPLPSTAGVETNIITGRDTFGTSTSPNYSKSKGTWRDQTKEERRSIGSNAVKIDSSAINGSEQKTSWQNSERRRQMLNEDTENIVNPSGYPRKVSGAADLIAAKYDYQIIPGDPNFAKMITLEDKLTEVRAAFGIPVHGSNQIAKAMKYYMYNRFKSPDPNLAHTKSTTHVFFTRPDLNILKFNGGANSQTLNHTETAMVWRRHPELFKLLTDRSRCKDNDNFNLLLSQQVTSFEIQDETLTPNKAGKSWNEYEMVYGDSYSGRTAGEFSCNFDETSDYSIINLIKLWITYIDNVSRGAWSPSYDLLGTGNKNSINSSHVFEKALDYASSVYVFKCGPDGEDVLYWTKYYGVFPVNTGASALSWDKNTPIGDGLKLNIRFNYSYKRDLSPISLIEFNNISNISSLTDAVSENSFNVNLGHSARPFTGPPFIEMKLGNAILKDGSVDYMRNRTEIRLKFKKDSGANLTDNLLYRYSMGLK